MSIVAMPPALDSLRDEMLVRLFRDLQVARYNEVYYHMMASSKRRSARNIKILSAIASSAALLGMLKAIPMIGELFSAILVAAAAGAGAIGPILGLDAKATQYEKATMGHAIVRERIKCLLGDLKVKQSFDEACEARMREIGSVTSVLMALDDASTATVKEKAWKQTLEEYPSESAWTIV